MFALCGNRTRDLLRSRRVFAPLRHIGRRIRMYQIGSHFFLHLHKATFFFPKIVVLGITLSDLVRHPYKNQK
jgi:hypothetical protein